ncbi:methyl-accepting chemotaxis protein, partial [bacterium]|nr:methyl-accepting chemotaxis protein [bacterium]
RAVEGIEAAGREVEEAVDMAAKAGEAMSHIESSARQVLGASTEISEALNEQSSASTLIAQNVASISNMVEVNTSAVKEVVSATEHLEKLARELVASVDRFRVEPVG